MLISSVTLQISSILVSAALVKRLTEIAILLRLTASPYEASISLRIELPANFDNRVIELERNAPDLRLLCLLQWEPNGFKDLGFGV